MTKSGIFDKPLHVVFLTKSLGFPHGMAATSRVRLLARALVENGAKVSVLCTSVYERPPVIENINAKGCYQGINFEYTTGTTVRSNSFLVRRYIELKGITLAIYRVIQLRRQGHLDCLYSYIPMQRLSTMRFILFVLAQMLRISVVIELCERPWSLQERPSILSRRFSPLTGAKGGIIISDFLQKWAETEATRLEQEFSILRIPILVDINEQHPNGYIKEPPTVLFAGSPIYDQTIRFILEAMNFVWESYPTCRLVITGCRQRDPLGVWLNKEISMRPPRGEVELAGYLSRADLLERYANSWALLIPLFNDIRSQARFPTKIGEYLASGRPVVTNSVGEVSYYLKDGVNAFVCKPGSTQLYGEKIKEVFSEPYRAQEIGLAGRAVAYLHFHYSSYGQRLIEFLALLCR